MRNEEGKGLGCADLGAIIFLAMIGGVILGFALGHQETSHIAEGVRRENPHDPLDGLGYIFIGYIVWGWMVGTVIGIGIALVLWLKMEWKRPHD